MKRKIKRKESYSWINPIKVLTTQPFLGDIMFPSSRDSRSGKRVAEKLKRFYCAERKGGPVDMSSLESFVNNPDKQMLIIWGGAGVGKSWFVRYQFTCGTFADTYDAGIIDLLRGGPSEAGTSIYKQLCPILERFLAKHYKSVHSAFLISARRRAILQYGEDASDDLLTTAAHSIASSWLSAIANQEYAERLMVTLEELDSPLLFLVIDNIDRISDDDQVYLLDLAKRILQNNRIRLIIPLRKSSLLLNDQFKGLKEQAYAEMDLSALHLDKMLEMRFAMSEDGASLTHGPMIKDGEYRTFFPDLYKTIFKSETGKTMLTISGDNAREALQLTQRLIHSDQLRGLANISNVQYAIAALMLLDHYSIDLGYPYIVNLFENEKPNEPGNNLIRFRVLEYFIRSRSGSPGDAYFIAYMQRLGYDEERVRAVLELMVGVGILSSLDGLIPEMIHETDPRDLGIFEITDIGREYWNTLIRLQWYFVGVKQGINIHTKYIKVEDDGVNEFILHDDLCAFLVEEEESERVRIKRWESHIEPMSVVLELPSRLASVALRHGRDELPVTK